jgi:hypothetical protein
MASSFFLHYLLSFIVLTIGTAKGFQESIIQILATNMDQAFTLK